MAPRRLHRTLIDYLVIAISPALIMLLVGSLTFFLLTVTYDGEHAGRLYFILACFVFAIVLIARISIEESHQRAALFAMALGVVILIAVLRFTDLGSLVTVGLIGLIWWSAHKLTWDCTMIDEEEDASGEGLLQSMGLDGNGPTQTSTDDDSISLEATTGHESPPEKGRNLWDRWNERERRPHTPGRWVVYFSLAALPLFGLLQGTIPSQETERRSQAFNLLLFYVGSGLGLLLTTSFLGLRRYLRQRRMEMPNDMAGMWLGVGGVMILVLLLLCSWLPRPSSAWKLPSALRVDSEHVDPNRWGMGEGPKDEEQGSRTVNDPEKNGKGAATKAGKKGAGNKGSNKGSGSPAKGKGNSGSKGQSKNSKSGQKSGSQSKSGQSGKKGTSSKQGGGNQKGNKSGQKGESAQREKGGAKSQQQNSQSQENGDGEKGQDDGSERQNGRDENRNLTDTERENEARSQNSAPRMDIYMRKAEFACGIKSERKTKLNVSREGLILLGMERTAACCVSLLSALFSNVRICRLVASFGVSHQRIFHIDFCI